MMAENQIQKKTQNQEKPQMQNQSNRVPHNEMISWDQLLGEAKSALIAANVPDADIDAWLLMEHCFSITKSFFFLNRRQIVESKEKLAQYRELIEQRAARIPLQYLTKTQGFMGLEFSVTPAVLIPRQDTETLVETVLSYAKDKTACKLIDVCTGSGCIAVSLAHYGNFARVAASDISSAALAVAKKNAAENHVSVQFYESDLLEQVPESFDIIVSNPPYIEDEVIAGLEPEVKDHEPMLALSGGSDGLHFYRRLTETAKNHLNPGGALFVEIGYNQWETVAALFRENGFSNPMLVHDLAGFDRVVWGVMDAL